MSDSFEQTIEIFAPIDKVWHALTDHQQFGTWFQVDLHEPFETNQITHGVITHPAAPGLRWVSITLAKDAPDYFALRWPHKDDMQLDPEDMLKHTTLAEFHLREQEGCTLLRLVESGFDQLPKSEQAAAFQNNFRGWQEQLQNIKNYTERLE
ncbi:MAG: SRPBCC family protein [Gammaproteobacteria bacterium]|nr:SRPBCC family protein [Gammaproteobacteria bacterium]